MKPKANLILTSVSILLVILTTTILSAQQPDDTIQIKSVNPIFLQSLIKSGIDSIRTAKKLPVLEFDSALYLAAADQAIYLCNQRWISHRQPSAQKLTPQKRVEYYGGRNLLCGENIAVSYISELMADNNGMMYYNYTYRQLADEFIRLWKNSPGHYGNIINKQYRYTGVAISIHTRTKRVVAVQVFGHKTKGA